MENDIEREEKIIKALNEKRKDNKTDISNIKIEGVDQSEIEDLIMLEKVLRLNEWKKETENILKKNRNKFKIYWPILAAVASMVIVLNLSYFAFNKNYFSDLIVENEILRGSETTLSDNIETPQDKAYQEFIIGKSNYHSREFEKAIASFESALKTPNLRAQFKEALLWHLCVAYLQNNQPLACESALNEIEKIKNPKYKISELDLLKLKTQLWLKKTF
jgi:hypothetical protein